MKTTPTTKILAIGTINPGFDQSQVFAVLPDEVRETVDLYLDGKIEQWYSLQGKPGVAFIINVTDPAVAHEMLARSETYDELRADPHWSAQPASLAARHATETLNVQSLLNVMRGASAADPDRCKNLEFCTVRNGWMAVIRSDGADDAGRPFRPFAGPGSIAMGRP